MLKLFDYGRCLGKSNTMETRISMQTRCLDILLAQLDNIFDIFTKNTRVCLHTSNIGHHRARIAKVHCLFLSDKIQTKPH